MQTPIQIAHLTSTEARPRGEAVADGAALPSVSTIVVTYNNERQIAGCLASLLADPAAAEEIIVLDNASADETAALVEQSFPDVHLIRSPQNLGFGRACNEAAAHSSGEYVAFVNPDAELQGAAITELVRFAEGRPEGGIYGGRTLSADGEPGMETCFAPPSLWGNLCFGIGLSAAFPRTRLDPESMGRWNRDSVREVGVVTGLLMLVRRDLWQRLGGFDDDFFMYAEDVDISLRAAQLGYRPCITPAAVVIHEGGGSAPSTGAGRVLLLTGRATLIRKRWSPLRRRAGILLLALGVGLRAASGREGWRHAWRERAQWMRGYPAGATSAPRIASPSVPTVAPSQRSTLPAKSRVRAALIRAVRRPLYYGDNVTCPCCGGRFSRLVTHRGVPNVRCPSCGSMERHRVLWLYLQQRTDLLTKRYRVLHVAPEASIQRLLRCQPTIEYVSADLASPLADVHCDIQALPFADDSFDVVICNHVLEHIPDDRRAMSEIARVLAPGGWAVLMCPIARGQPETLTDLSVGTPEDAMRVYGQEDHVRLYGADYRDRLEEAGFAVSVERLLDDLPPELVDRCRLRRSDDLFEDDYVYIGRIAGKTA
jgi:N-acetylglucosaminyl-diphospho-decaprenol L-rhamnosyltransferase